MQEELASGNMEARLQANSDKFQKSTNYLVDSKKQAHAIQSAQRGASRLERVRGASTPSLRSLEGSWRFYTESALTGEGSWRFCIESALTGEGSWRFYIESALTREGSWRFCIESALIGGFVRSPWVVRGLHGISLGPL